MGNYNFHELRFLIIISAGKIILKKLFLKQQLNAGHKSALWVSRLKIRISLLSGIHSWCLPYAGFRMEWFVFCFTFFPWEFFKAWQYFDNLFQLTSWFGPLCSLGLLCKLFSPANNREQRDQSLEWVSWSYSNHKAEGWIQFYRSSFQFRVEVGMEVGLRDWDLHCFYD